MQTEDFCIYTVSEPFGRRVMRIIYMVALVFSVCGLLAYFDIISLGAGVGMGFIMLCFLWDFYGKHYQVAIRSEDIFATFGDGSTPIKWSEIKAVEPAFNSIGFLLKDGARRSIRTAPFSPCWQGHLLQMIESVFAIYQSEGPLVLPRPESVKIKTRRMVVLPLERKDQESFVALKQDPSEAFHQLHDSFPKPLSERIFMEGILSADSKMFEWHLGMFLEDDLQLIGYVTVNGDSSIVQRSAQLGLGLHREFRGQGFGSEAVEGVLGYLEEKSNIQKVTAGCFVNNPACAKALENAGMKKVARYERYWFRNGEWQEGFEYEKVLQSEKAEDLEPSDAAAEDGEEKIRLG